MTERPIITTESCIAVRELCPAPDVESCFMRFRELPYCLLLDSALRKALSPVYPALSRIHLADYKVRILDGKDGTEATTRVLIDSRSDNDSWSTVGASPNIIEASLQALVDAIEYGLIRADAKLSEADFARSSERVVNLTASR